MRNKKQFTKAQSKAQSKPLLTSVISRDRNLLKPEKLSYQMSLITA